ncbi:MAG TPA: hypothetical protein VIC71_04415 [Gammaproteobacteria bacterium]
MNKHLMLGALMLIAALATISALQDGATASHGLLFTALSACFFASDRSLWPREKR